MEESRSNWRPLLVGVVLLLLLLVPAVYVGSYAALVTPNGMRMVAPYEVLVISQDYRCGDFPAKVIFWPLEQLDRKLRPSVWNSVQGFALVSPAVPPVAQLCMPGVFLIRLYDKEGEELGHGSGFIIDGAEREWRGVTAAHVIEGAESAVVEMPDGKVGHVELCQENWGRDLALVQIVFPNNVHLESLKLETRSASPDVFCIGNPENGDKVAAGEVIARETIEGVRCLRITAAIGHGSSGGPVIDSYGQVIGIASAMPERGENIAVSVAELADMIAREDWEIRELQQPPAE